MDHYLGVDLGATNIKAGVTTEAGEVRAKLSVPTESDGGPMQVLANMADAAKAVANRAGLTLSDIRAVGIGSPGAIDLEQGVVRSAPNLPDWNDVRLTELISQATGLPAILENDANAAAFGEFWVGAGRDKSIRHLVMLTLGTGVGSGLIVDGRIIHGAQGEGGEGGHMVVVADGRLCGCGQRGCLEAYASASHTVRRALETLRDPSGQASTLRDLMDQQGEQAVTSKAIFDAAIAGDRLALEIVDETTDKLGIACVNFARILDPQMIVFAGGMIAAGDFLFERIRRAFHRHNWLMEPPHARIVPAELGNEAGIIGAAGVAWDAVQRGGLA